MKSEGREQQWMGLSEAVSGFMLGGLEGVEEGCNLGKWRGARPVILYVIQTDRYRSPYTEPVPWLHSNLHSY
jgi:hypothetical protein